MKVFVLLKQVEDGWEAPTDAYLSEEAALAEQLRRGDDNVFVCECGVIDAEENA